MQDYFIVIPVVHSVSDEDETSEEAKHLKDILLRNDNTFILRYFDTNIIFE